MSYSDSVFLVFFVTVFSVYYLFRHAWLQVVWLVVASLFFYAWESPPLLLIFLCSWFVTSTSSYGVLIAGERRLRAKLFAIIGVLTNLGLLGFFKYKFLFISSADYQSPQSISEWLLLAPLPIGISFYTFHGISLLVDVFRGNNAIPPPKQGRLKKHLSDTLLYLVFFPQLIAGPIIKAKDFFPQVVYKRFSDIDFPACARILILGFFLKRFVADNLNDHTFWIAYPYFLSRSSIDLILMLYGFSAQIFADFSGYSLIAIGLAKLLGYKLPDNFNFPYMASSIADFWRRWHMSLSSWLRDYLYIPLGGSRHGVTRTYFNLVIVMFLGGLWHGAAWSFAVWGLWHGLGLVIERTWIDSRFMTTTNWFVRAVRIFVVFNFVTLGWLFFKLQDFSQALEYLQALMHSDTSGMNRGLMLYIALYGSGVLVYHIASVYRDSISRRIKDVAYGGMLFLILTSSGSSKPFIYFQF
jgi:alginate O-acetyltransferase complex protein AlgI